MKLYSVTRSPTPLLLSRQAAVICPSGGLASFACGIPAFYLKLHTGAFGCHCFVQFKKNKGVIERVDRGSSIEQYLCKKGFRVAQQ